MAAEHRATRTTRGLCAILAPLVLSPAVLFAAEIYVLDARIERAGTSALSPTFIVTPGERAVLMFDGERDIDVAMTITPRDAAAGAASTGATFDLRVELVDGTERYVETVEAALAEPVTVQLGERELEVLVRVQEPLEESTATPSDGG